MLLTVLFSLLFAASAAATPSHKRAAVSSNVTVYAYGTGISGLPILADSKGIMSSFNPNGTLPSTVADPSPSGTAYVSVATPSNLSTISWTIASDTTVPWNVTIQSTSTNTTSTTASTFYIITTTDSYSPVGFVSSNDTIPAGAVVVGFTLYGSDIMYLSGSVLEAQFWAKASDSGNEWEILWNSNGESQSDSVPVTLKTTAPTS